MTIEKATYSVEELAEYLGVDTELIYSLTLRNDIPHIRIDTRILFKKTSIEKWLDEKETQNYAWLK